MAHIQDRWYRDKTDPVTGEIMVNSKGKPVQEPTPEHGKGLRYRVKYQDPDKRERSKSFPDKQLGRAKEFMTKVENDKYARTYTDPNAGNVEFKAYAVKVLAARSQDESTVDNLTNRMNSQAYPFLGRKLLSSFATPELIRSWLAWMNSRDKPVSAAYQRQVFDLVSTILDAAVVDEKIRKNPCKDASVRPPKPIPRTVTPWRETRLRKVELALPARFKPCISLGAGVGLRQGEMFAFSLDNVDRKEMVYHCTRQMVTVNGMRKFKLPKGHKTRVVPLGHGVLDGLDAYAELFPPVEITLPWAERDGRETETIRVLMVNDAGDLYTRQAFNNVVWRPTFAKAGLSYVDREDGMHALRHLFASALLALGVTVKELAAYLGHASEAFTLKTYTHLMPSSYSRARQAVNEMFTPRRSAQAAAVTA
ncbi:MULTISPECIES: site-specific integrase [unclassified Crossiella]|uniref:tyrosine-type recombinase/integrase n=1 Tax=unclassified Crossiella TaxID=2620835 RepID=UPI001FFF1E64|nr:MULTISPECIES: site-specific integrase [unclassified Crossiella]MCK2244087.1 tyrosine-type recombinase/integrase [Crossiella sp. S99.2]MCK2258607.1 tyrosine-type recombinase/integrase [Crossiella sp. S99.1]